jgi:hypothetical protein
MRPFRPASRAVRAYLAGVEVGRAEDGGVLVAVAPLLVREGVDVKWRKP